MSFGRKFKNRLQKVETNPSNGSTKVENLYFSG